LRGDTPLCPAAALLPAPNILAARMRTFAVRITAIAREAEPLLVDWGFDLAHDVERLAEKLACDGSGEFLQDAGAVLEPNIVLFAIEDSFLAPPVEKQIPAVPREGK
jgi:hypothetical protein